MAKLTPQLLAETLARAHHKARKNIIRGQDLDRQDRERLEHGEWISRIIKGWYIFRQPTLAAGDTTRWYASYWDFLSLYLKDRFDDQYCLSASSSLEIHLGSTLIPKQLLVMVTKGGSSVISLPFETSLLIYQENLSAYPAEIEQKRDINVMPLEMALYRISPNFFIDNPDQAQIALQIADKTHLRRTLLSCKNNSAAERIIGAYQKINEKGFADSLLTDFKIAGYSINPVNPFKKNTKFLEFSSRVKSPYSARIRSMWQNLREDIISLAPEEPGIPRAKKKYLHEVDQIYTQDAYHSLSIEGYSVTEELINHIATGKWAPDKNSHDHHQVSAMAAKGYLSAFLAVKHSIERVLNKENAGRVFSNDLHIWHRELFSPSVTAGLIKVQDLAGYRNDQVYIRGSLHTPLPKYALADAMETLFECLEEEPIAFVRAVLGHFIFVFIHPYMDGNGRLGRFLMNLMLASGGFPWTIIHVENRKKYLSALEKASTEGKIKPLAQFIIQELKGALSISPGKAQDG